jgi:cation:H+ antiporter
MASILGFIVCATIIFFSGKKLSFYGDLIAEKTGLGRAWIGLILMASVTSLPELIVGISSVAIVKSADLAVGDVIGSCAFNLAILALIDIFVPKRQPLFLIASSRHILSAALGILLMGLVALGLYLPSAIVIIPGIGLISIACLVIYLFSVRLLYRFEARGKLAELISGNEINTTGMDLKTLGGKYSLFAAITITAALFIPYFANHLAQQTGLGATFVGTLFLAATTSLPEIAVSLAAIRMASVDLAVGNLLGSNIFNILILVVDDVFYTEGVLLKDASDNNLISLFSAIMMTAITIAGLTYKSETKKFRIALDAALILFFYIMTIVLLYYISR